MWLLLANNAVYALVAVVLLLGVLLVFSPESPFCVTKKKSKPPPEPQGTLTIPDETEEAGEVETLQHSLDTQMTVGAVAVGAIGTGAYLILRRGRLR